MYMTDKTVFLFSTFWWVLVSGARTLIEAQPVIDYIGHGYRYRKSHNYCKLHFHFEMIVPSNCINLVDNTVIVVSDFLVHY